MSLSHTLRVAVRIRPTWKEGGEPAGRDRAGGSRRFLRPLATTSCQLTVTSDSDS